MTNHVSGQITGRALDDLLAGYASGQLSPALHVLIAGHLELVPASRAFVGSLEAANGAALEAASPAPLSDPQAMLAGIFAADTRADDPVEISQTPRVLPAAISHFAGAEFDALRWRTILPGVKACKVATAEQGEAVLYWVKRGRKLPAHSHEGSEYTLVLKGGYSDVSGHYRCGDIAIADHDLDHHPRMDEDEDCICYVVSDAPFRLTGPIGGLVQRLFRL